MLTIATATAIATAISSTLAEVYKDSKSTLRNYLKNKDFEKISMSIEADINSICMVRKIFEEKKTSLRNFFHPPRILKSLASGFQADCIDHIDKNQSIIIYGTAGQGKSIYMRYLALNEHNYSRRVPIFIELRYLKEDKNIFELIKHQFNKIGFPDLDNELLIKILKTGRFSIFLDGVDEIPRKYALDFKQNIEYITGQAPKCRFTYSSRPGSLSKLTSSNNNITEVTLAKIHKSEIKQFLEKLGCTTEHANFLYQSLLDKDNKIIDILTTPLLIELFKYTYGTSANLPNNSIEFYKNIFHTLVFHHDENKELYTRERATNLDNSQMLKAFELFSYFSTDYGISLDHAQFNECATSTKQILELDFTTEGLKTDITEGLCLMIREGTETVFIHKSIQEYFAASCIANQTDNSLLKDILESIYSVYEKEQELAEVIKFFKIIDEDRYEKYYVAGKNKKLIEDSSKDGELSFEKLKDTIQSNTLLIEAKFDQDDVIYKIPVINSDNVNTTVIECIKKVIPFALTSNNEKINKITKNNIFIQNYTYEDEKINEIIVKVKESYEAAILENRKIDEKHEKKRKTAIQLMRKN